MTTAPPAGGPALTAAPTTSPGRARLETHGGALVNILRSSGAVGAFARASLKAAGLSFAADEAGGIPDWYSLDANLRVLNAIARRFGDRAVFRIGLTVPKHARFPPGMTTLRQALAGLDCAYHTNHRRDDAVMFDPDTGTKLNGIGNYDCQETPEGLLVAESTSVYPCSFDLGLVSGLAARFAPKATVRHGNAPCRRRGSPVCHYPIVQ
jgi:hypothetical protein